MNYLRFIQLYILLQKLVKLLDPRIITIILLKILIIIKLKEFASVRLVKKRIYMRENILTIIGN